MRIAVARLARIAIGIERFAKRQPVECRAMGEQGGPGSGPAEVSHQLARQTERKIETADPGSGTRQQRFEFRKGSEALDAFELQCILAQDAAGGGDGLGRARRAGEVDAVDPQRSSWRNASSAAERWPARHTSIVFASATLAGSACMATCPSTPVVRSTDFGTTAMPPPAATQAVIA